MPVLARGPGVLYTTTTGSTTTWQQWNQSWTAVGTVEVTASGAMTGSWIQWNTCYTGTAEQQAERAARERQVQADWQQRYEEQERERAAVRERAEELLTALLTDEQLQTWREHQWFTVRGSSSRRTYRIRRGITGNVDRMTETGNEAEVRYCAHPPGIPAEDVCLAQLLLLTTDEDAFLRVANATPRQPQAAVAAAEPVRAVA